MQILGSAELTEDVQKKGLCVNCGSCVGQCPYFKSYKGKIAMLFPCTIKEGRCYANCPKTEVDLDKISNGFFQQPYDGAPLGYYLEIKKGRAGAKMKSKGRFQNGGAVSSLVAFALKKGLIDAAALTGRQGLIPVPVLAESEEDVLNCASSKYMAAPLVSLVNDYIKSGKSGLGIVGTPCQLTGLAQIRLNPLKQEDFKDSVALTIGLLCTWSVDTRKFIDLVSGLTDLSKITAMDVPPPPADTMSIVSDGKLIEIPLDDIRKIVPEGCSICPDMTAEFSDISVGALEGDSSFNTIIIRTEKGARLVAEAVYEGYLEIDDFPMESLENLTKAAAGKKKRALVKAKKLNLLNNSHDRSSQQPPRSNDLADFSINSQEQGRSALLIDESIVQKILNYSA